MASSTSTVAGLIFKVDGRERLAREYSRQDGRAYHDVIDQDWQAGEHRLAFELQPLTPAEKQVRSLTIRIKSVTIRGPLEERYWVRPKNYTRFFPKDVPASPADRPQYARELLGRFADQGVSAAGGARNRRSAGGVCHRRLRAGRANFRGRHRPGDDGRAGVPGVSLSRGSGCQPGSSEPFPLIDEYALASRLSYFLWSSMPDQELIRLAGSEQTQGKPPRPGHPDARRRTFRGVRPPFRRPVAAGA